MKKNFLLVASYPSSILSFRGELIKALQHANFDVHVAAPFLEEDKQVVSALKAAGVTPHKFTLERAGLNPVKDFLSLLSLYRLIRKHHFAYVLGYTVKPVIYGSIAARLAGVPGRFALITGLGYAFAAEGNRKRQFVKSVIQKLYKISLSGVNTVFFQNPDDQSLFIENNLVPGSKCRVVNGSGVDTHAYSVRELPGTVNFLLIGRLLGDKGVREYVAAARKILKKHDNVNFFLVGWIDKSNPDAITDAELESWISEKIIKYLGSLSDVRPAIANCSVYVLPSYREGTPRTVLEAMSMGRPIITTDAPGCRETVENGRNGYLVPVKSVDGLVDAMEKFILTPAMAEDMGAESRVIAENKFDVHKVNNFMLKEMGVSVA